MRVVLYYVHLLSVFASASPSLCEHLYNDSLSTVPGVSILSLHQNSTRKLWSVYLSKSPNFLHLRRLGGVSVDCSSHLNTTWPRIITASTEIVLLWQYLRYYSHVSWFYDAKQIFGMQPLSEQSRTNLRHHAKITKILNTGYKIFEYPEALD